MSVTTEQQPLLTKDDAARFFNVSKATIDNWLVAGKIKPIRIGRGCVRFPADLLSAVNFDLTKHDGKR